MNRSVFIRYGIVKCCLFCRPGSELGGAQLYWANCCRCAYRSVPTCLRLCKTSCVVVVARMALLLPGLSCTVIDRPVTSWTPSSVMVTLSSTTVIVFSAKIASDKGDSTWDTTVRRIRKRGVQYLIWLRASLQLISNRISDFLMFRLRYTSDYSGSIYCSINGCIKASINGTMEAFPSSGPYTQGCLKLATTAPITEEKETNGENFPWHKIPADTSLCWPERLIDKLNLAAPHQEAFSRAEKVSPTCRKTKRITTSYRWLKEEKKAFHPVWKTKKSLCNMQKQYVELMFSPTPPPNFYLPAQVV